MPRIIVIEDDPDMRQLMAEMLKPEWDEVILAADARNGLAEHRIAAADLVITDIYMPNQDGVETILELKRLSREIPIIAISGHDEAEVMLSVAKKLGAVAVLRKPFDREELLTAVRQALGAKSGNGDAKIV